MYKKIITGALIEILEDVTAGAQRLCRRSLAKAYAVVVNETSHDNNTPRPLRVHPSQEGNLDYGFAY